MFYIFRVDTLAVKIVQQARGVRPTKQKKQTTSSASTYSHTQTQSQPVQTQSAPVQEDPKYITVGKKKYKVLKVFTTASGERKVTIQGDHIGQERTFSLETGEQTGGYFGSREISPKESSLQQKYGVKEQPIQTSQNVGYHDDYLKMSYEESQLPSLRPELLSTPNIAQGRYAEELKMSYPEVVTPDYVQYQARKNRTTKEKIRDLPSTVVSTVRTKARDIGEAPSALARVQGEFQQAYRTEGWRGSYDYGKRLTSRGVDLVKSAGRGVVKAENVLRYTSPSSRERNYPKNFPKEYQVQGKVLDDPDVRFAGSLVGFAVLPQLTALKFPGLTKLGVQATTGAFAVESVGKFGKEKTPEALGEGLLYSGLFLTTIRSPSAKGYEKGKFEEIPPEFRQEYKAYAETTKGFRGVKRPISDIKFARFESLESQPKAQKVIEKTLINQKDFILGGTGALESGGVKLARRPQDVDIYARSPRKALNVFEQALTKEKIPYKVKEGKIFFEPGKEALTFHGVKDVLYPTISTVKGRFKPPEVYIYKTPKGISIVDPNILAQRKFRGAFEPPTKKKLAELKADPKEFAQSFGGKFYRYSKDIPAFVQSSETFLAQQKAGQLSGIPLLKQYQQYRTAQSSLFLEPYLSKGKGTRATAEPLFFTGKPPSRFAGLESVTFFEGTKGQVGLTPTSYQTPYSSPYKTLRGDPELRQLVGIIPLQKGKKSSQSYQKYKTQEVQSIYTLPSPKNKQTVYNFFSPSVKTTGYPRAKQSTYPSLPYKIQEYPGRRVGIPRPVPRQTFNFFQPPQPKKRKKIKFKRQQVIDEELFNPRRFPIGYTPDFTARVLGLPAMTVTRKQAVKITKQGYNPFQTRRGLYIPKNRQAKTKKKKQKR